MHRVISKRTAPPIRRPGRRIKRVLDITLVLLTAPVLAPLIGLCALAVLLESGRPIFFLQNRTGVGGRRFRMYKFRTMVPNAEQMKHELAHLNELTWPDFKMSNDPRVTRVGRFLRRSSLDELPQLINVLKGDMSLVGPRPTSFAADTYDLWHTERLEVTPGVTGLWQVSGRSDVDFDERARLDIEYIEKQSMLYDLQILLKTFAAIFTKRGAY
ncbi:sugar transferase [Roseimaritima ulvae]|uniref:UDP-N-acetylgalactosamine-undecaprenyl-phosphate N-acetylgalactosaminephosphotransferase n=1 Tax=Roseimaritima ulvae TaxID=980254 RepID=A0A5B9R6I2_9BACT|nr:sugar transferase [Roseimaritima ulvae]QEG41903.1 UDP-N-acetylgalactosamine-undecaprenyl-phosphate N-acetylgalactosaminephosphotransferase [Roseimaritima ulvae]